MTRQGHEKDFWGAGHSLYLHLQDGYTGMHAHFVELRCVHFTGYVLHLNWKQFHYGSSTSLQTKMLVIFF